MKINSWLIKLFFSGILFLCLSQVQGASALAATVIYVPLDDRPVCRDYVLDTAKAAGMQVLTPPVNLLSSRDRRGDPDQLWSWLEENWNQADYAVIASDSLIYGGLVESRTHHLDYKILAERLARLEKLKTANPTVRLYVFSTIMRSPKASSGGVEPDYYEIYGPDIFRLTALADQEVSVGLSGAEQEEMRSLAKIIPSAYMTDWLDRRAKNLLLNEQLAVLARKGVLDYLIIGRDDSAPFSQSHREWHLLQQKTADLSLARFAAFPGADQLGMLLLTRAYNDSRGQIPFVKVLYAPGPGGGTVPSYEDQPVDFTLNGHVIAAGGVVLPFTSHPDLLLAVNTPADGVTLEADAATNTPQPTKEHKIFIQTLEKSERQGVPIALADLGYANGADNGLLNGLARQNMLAKLEAYAGWNTASNKLGYAIAQGIMAESMTPLQRQDLLAVRYLDDWAYQANIRGNLMDIAYRYGDRYLFHINELKPLLLNQLTDQERSFAAQNLTWIQPNRIQMNFPWNRLFEIEVFLGRDKSEKTVK